jgi:hypothetical protein
VKPNHDVVFGDLRLPSRPGCLRYELAIDGFGVYTVFYLTDATRAEAAQAIHAVAHMRHTRLFFEGDVRNAEAFARDHGMVIAT